MEQSLPQSFFSKMTAPSPEGAKVWGRARAELDFCPVWGGGRFVKRPYRVCSSSLLFTNFAGGCGQPPLRVGWTNLLCGKGAVREDWKDFTQSKPTIWIRHACAACGKPPARVPHDKTFPRKVLSPLLRFFGRKRVSPSADGSAGRCPTPHRLCKGGRNFCFCSNFHSRGFVKILY